MGKGSHHEEYHEPSDGQGSGRKKSILHHFHHNPWSTVKKKLPNKKHGSGKHSVDKESAKSMSDSEEMQQQSDSPTENPVANDDVPKKKASHGHRSGKRRAESGSPPKTSMKSRIKALFIEEMVKKKGRHQRSSSCPEDTQPDNAKAIHNAESSGVADLSEEGNSRGEVVGRHDRVHSVAILDPVLTKASEDMSNAGTLKPKMNYLKQNEVYELVRQPVRDHTLLQDKSIYAIEPSKGASLQESKLFINALDLLNMRTEVFQKILLDQSSSLAHQLHDRHAANVRPAFTKSVSFPVPGSARQTSQPTNNFVAENESCEKDGKLLHDTAEDKQLAVLNGSCTENGSHQRIKRSDSAYSIPFNILRKMHHDKLALNHFKKLRAKLKFVIPDKKEEKNRIVKDAVHHKVPYGKKVPKDHEGNLHVNPEFKADKFRKSLTTQQPGSECGKSLLESFKRASSFNESFDKYNRLLETNFNKQAQDCSCEKDSQSSTAANTPSSAPRRRHATLERIFSLPELSRYSSFNIEDCTGNNSVHASDTSVAGISSVGGTDLTEQQPSEEKLQLTTLPESGSPQKLSDIGGSFHDSTDLKPKQSASFNDLNLYQGPRSPDLQPPEPNQVPYNDDSNCQEDEICQENVVPVSDDSEENFLSIDQESKVRQYYHDLLNIQVDAKHEAEFNYVKDVLELSGFSRDGLLGKWHSAEHPVEPMMFEEVEGCLLGQPECPGNEEGGICYHLLLLDLINEVLLRIYEQSCCYWPMALTNQSLIHRMPNGGRVLEEVWTEISWLLSSVLELDQGIDDILTRDFAKQDDWLNLQPDAECVALEVEDLIFDDLLEDIIPS